MPWEVSYKIIKVLVTIAILMIIVVWCILGYMYIDTVKVKARLDEQQSIGKLLILHNDSVKNSIIKGQKEIIRKLDSVNYVLYLKAIEHAN